MRRNYFRNSVWRVCNKLHGDKCTEKCRCKNHSSDQLIEISYNASVIYNYYRLFGSVINAGNSDSIISIVVNINGIISQTMLLEICLYVTIQFIFLFIQIISFQLHYYDNYVESDKIILSCYTDPL